MDKVEKISITDEHINLGQFLKLTNLFDSGGFIKNYLQNEGVFVNNVKEHRRGRKLYNDDVVQIDESNIFILHAEKRGRLMYLKELQLKHFRNYESLDIKFDNSINVIIGENAQGKTNLLEAIYLLAFSKSYRTANDKELIQWNEEFAKITGKLVKENAKPLPMELIYHSQGKKAKINHLEQKRLSEFIGTMNVVMFAPEDLALVKGSPQVRRRCIDMELGQIEPMYLYHLAQYQKVLKQRNHLLKQLRHEATDKAFLFVLTDQLIQHALVILKKRFHFLELLKSWAIPIHKQISRGLETLKIAYSSPISVLETDGEETMENKLRNAYQK